MREFSRQGRVLAAHADVGGIAARGAIRCAIVHKSHSPFIRRSDVREGYKMHDENALLYLFSIVDGKLIPLAKTLTIGGVAGLRVAVKTINPGTVSRLVYPEPGRDTPFAVYAIFPYKPEDN